MNNKVQALLDLVKTFNAGNSWDVEGLMQWQFIKKAIQDLELAEVIKVFEAIVILASNEDQEEKEYPDPLNECLMKLRKLLAIGFWAKVIEIELSEDNQIMAKLKVTEFVGTLPQFSRSAIKDSLINTNEFTIAHFASACLKQPAPDMFF